MATCGLVRSVGVQACPSTSTSGDGVAASPGLDPGQHRYGSAFTFDQARVDFEAAWAVLLPQIPARAFNEYRRDREHRAEIQAVHARGERLPSETPSSLMPCVCGVTFDSHKPAESYDHRLHIYAAQAKTAS
jgi:hypothetical protein